uniref:Sodium/hydrogen exchanger n=1 Tax=Meloidogyne floridensis TaxID=298350 RepID=A0A915ND64_9BILA
MAEAIPDSALLIVLGLLLGSILRFAQVDEKLFFLPSDTFFLYLLPPIIFEAGYFMPNRELFDNIDSVMLFAFCGTIWNTLTIGISLFWISKFGIFSVGFSSFQILLFASLISAVDPVAVIAVFEQININSFLFINVFGEALFNDGVSVVLYQMFRKFLLIGIDNLSFWHFIAGCASFLIISIGGLFIGLLFAIVASLATKFATRIRLLAPVFVFVVPYLAYLSAELFGLSSILAIVACGIGMKQYVKENLSIDASSSVKYFVIFMFLGLSTASHNHHFDWAFIGITIGFCLLFRIFGVVVQCLFLNKCRARKFSFSDQFVLSYGGLRGAIAFGLVVSLDDKIPAKQMFVTTCIAVIFFTVFVQGITIRPLLYFLKVEKKDIEKKDTMTEKVYIKYCDYMMSGLEDIIGFKGKNSVRDKFERFNAKTLKPILTSGKKHPVNFDTSYVVRAYRKITLNEANRLVRASSNNYKNNKNLRRIVPAPSPSSECSTISYGNCWTVNSNNVKEEEEGNNKNNLILEENIELLYSMFSRLLDRKIEEIEKIKEKEEEGEDDNYFNLFIKEKNQKENKNQQRRKEKRRKERRRYSLSPSFERNLCLKGINKNNKNNKNSPKELQKTTNLMAKIP